MRPLQGTHTQTMTMVVILPLTMVHGFRQLTELTKPRSRSQRSRDSVSSPTPDDSEIAIWIRRLQSQFRQLTNPKMRALRTPRSLHDVHLSMRSIRSAPTPRSVAKPTPMPVDLALSRPALRRFYRNGAGCSPQREHH